MSHIHYFFLCINPLLRSELHQFWGMTVEEHGGEWVNQKQGGIYSCSA